MTNLAGTRGTSYISPTFTPQYLPVLSPTSSISLLMSTMLGSSPAPPEPWVGGFAITSGEGSFPDTFQSMIERAALYSSMTCIQNIPRTFHPWRTLWHTASLSPPWGQIPERPMSDLPTKLIWRLLSRKCRSLSMSLLHRVVCLSP